MNVNFFLFRLKSSYFYHKILAVFTVNMQLWNRDGIPKNTTTQVQITLGKTKQVVTAE